MLIGDRLRELREHRKLSQGDVEKRTGLWRCYISRVENSHTVPLVATLEKLARALELPMYQFFYEGDKPPELLPMNVICKAKNEWGQRRKDARLLQKMCMLLSKMKERDRKLIFVLAQKVAQKNSQ